MSTETLTRTTSGVALNLTYAYPLDDGRFAVTKVPGGFWAVKLRQRGSQWIAFAVPRHTTPGDPFLIAVGDDQDAVRSVGIRWRDQAVTLAGRYDRVVYAGVGNATHERLNPGDTDGQRPTIDTQERRS
ncbi:hypothetical protein ABZ671_01610 [Micromonospora sp. NPDC006766]|uniref:hypothetical protein n=1 Tax=Micromonospora sp. NPDC006766 TaxID=3154778 RepID=UPI0033E54FAD